VGDLFVLAPNCTFSDATCRIRTAGPSAVFQAHPVPMDSKYDSTFSKFYITFHGSWDRQPATGLKVVAVPFTKGADGAYKTASPLNTQRAYTHVFWNPDITRYAGNGPSFGSRCFGPAGLLFDLIRRMYMMSDNSTNGEVWVLGKYWVRCWGEEAGLGNMISE
ncbi:hypothetical protein BJ878DRAFT_424861, partial [Calycina marina]